MRNRRTALILLSIALVFFAGVVARYWLLGG
ncbi:MAG TPA: cytochrome oxidase small assembly protein [Burkholderiaceae bacterium]|nr:cytochrome oxidase small assembly protein [Burkholderiaceae bacterium]